MKKQYKITLYDYNIDALITGLESVGKKIEDFSNEDMEKMLSFAIGYCDFSNEQTIKEILGDLNS